MNISYSAPQEGVGCLSSLDWRRARGGRKMGLEERSAGGKRTGNLSEIMKIVRKPSQGGRSVATYAYGIFPRAGAV